ncbi:hypothetical protein C8T65DRAFT_577120 [Cerioporus squamosus]|nr:hypothetical protein C8T65DRAFT_581773 [Cerioporus squamosus]KAI0706713.1 hypothetical protein C8T65DRAFT_577120 [Cerioporus squamosus]
MLFDPTIRARLPVGAHFRVFGVASEWDAAVVARAARGVSVNDEEVEVFTDGSCTENGLDSAISGCGVWFGANDPRNTAALVPGLVQSNQAAEVYAVSLAVAAVPPFAPLHVVTDSRYVLKGMMVHRWAWEDDGWYGLANRDLLRGLIARLRARSAPTTLRWVKGHSDCTGNDGADALARLAVEKKLTKAIPSPPMQYVASGAKLAVLSQKLAYRYLCDAGARKDRRSTLRNLDLVLNAVDSFAGVRPKPSAVWLGVWRMDCDRQVRSFWWKLLHGAHRLGAFWKNIPGYEARAACPFCGAEESMRHIVSECPNPWRLQVWEAAMCMLAQRKIPVEHLEYDHLLAACVMKVYDDAEPRAERRAATRLFRLVAVELVYLVWIMRCEWVIGRNGEGDRAFSPAEALARWMWRVNRKLKIDIARTKPYVRTGALAPNVVTATWQGLICDELTLPEDWTTVPGVLVGMHAVQPRHGVG